MFCMGSEINAHPGRGLRRLDNEFSWPYSRSYTRRHAGRKEGAPDEHERLYQPRHPFIRQGSFFPLCFKGGGKHEIKKHLFLILLSPSSADNPVKLLQFAIWDDEDDASFLLQGKKPQAFKFHRTKKPSTIHKSEGVPRWLLPLCMYVCIPSKKKEKKADVGSIEELSCHQNTARIWNLSLSL